MAAPIGEKVEICSSSTPAVMSWNRRNMSAPPTLTCSYTSKEAKEVDPQQYRKLLSEMAQTSNRTHQLLASEQFTLARLLFKLHNQQHRWKWYQLMRKIDKVLHRIQDINLTKLMKKLKECCYQTRSSPIPIWHMGSRQMQQFLLVRFMSLAKLCSYVLTLCEQTALFLVQFLGEGHMISNNVVFCAIVSRIWILTQAFLSNVIKWYGQLYPWCSKLLTMPTPWLPPDEHLPESLLVWLEAESIPVNLQNNRSKKTKSQKLLSKWFSDQDEAHKSDGEILEENTTKLGEAPMLDLGEPVLDRHTLSSLDTLQSNKHATRKSKRKKSQSTEVNNNDIAEDSIASSVPDIEIIEPSTIDQIDESTEIVELSATDQSDRVNNEVVLIGDDESIRIKRSKKKKRRHKDSDDHQTEQSSATDLLRVTENAAQYDSQTSVCGKEVKPLSKKKRKNLSQGLSHVSNNTTKVITVNKKGVKLSPDTITEVEEELIGNQIMSMEQVPNDDMNGEDGLQDAAVVTKSGTSKKKKKKKKKKQKLNPSMQDDVDSNHAANVVRDFDTTAETSTHDLKSVELSPNTIRKINTEMSTIRNLDVTIDDNESSTQRTEVEVTESVTSKKKKKKRKKQKLNPSTQVDDNATQAANVVRDLETTVETSAHDLKRVELSPNTIHKIGTEMSTIGNFDVTIEDNKSSTQRTEVEVNESVASKKKKKKRKKRKLNSSTQDDNSTEGVNDVRDAKSSTEASSHPLESFELSPNTIRNIETEVIKRESISNLEDNKSSTPRTEVEVNESVETKKKKKKRKKKSSHKNLEVEDASNPVESSPLDTVSSPVNRSGVENETTNFEMAVSNWYQSTLPAAETNQSPSSKKKRKRKRRQSDSIPQDQIQKAVDDVSASNWYQSTLPAEETNQSPSSKKKRKRKRRQSDSISQDQIQHTVDDVPEHSEIAVELDQMERLSETVDNVSEHPSFNKELNQVEEESETLPKKKRKKKKKHSIGTEGILSDVDDKLDVSRIQPSIVCDLGQIKQHSSKKRKHVSDADIDDIFSALQF